MFTQGLVPIWNPSLLAATFDCGVKKWITDLLYQLVDINCLVLIQQELFGAITSML